MTDKQKKGLGMAISGAASMVVGVLSYFLTDIPVWVSLALNTLGFILPALGIKMVMPNYEGEK